MGKLWKSEEDKLIKSGRKWAASDYVPYRFAELFCEKCGKSLGKFDMVTTNVQTYMYCDECVKPYIREVPFNLTEDVEVIYDAGNEAKVKYRDNYYSEMVVYKVCYFNKKGRYIKVKGKTYYLNLNKELEI